MYNGIEKRKFLRARFPCKILIYNFPEHSISTHTENISAGGVRVIIGERIEANSLVGVEIHFRENKIQCRGRVAWVVDKKSPYRKGISYHDTGIEFCEIDEEDRSMINDTVEKMLCLEK